MPPPLSPSVPAAPGTRDTLVPTTSNGPGCHGCSHRRRAGWRSKLYSPGGTGTRKAEKQAGKQAGEGRQPQVLQGCSLLSQRHPVGAGGRAAMRHPGAVGPGTAERRGAAAGGDQGSVSSPVSPPDRRKWFILCSRLGARSVPGWDSCRIRRFPSAPCQPVTPRRS